MELLRLHDLLIDAFNAVEDNKPALARMRINGALVILRPIKDDYADIRTMYLACELANETLKSHFLGSVKHSLLDTLDEMIVLSEAWIEMRAA